tara:strand:+ start:252 stop:587 length:336 start_codon:yes stop_codon:yes gene_type:complete
MSKKVLSENEFLLYEEEGNGFISMTYDKKLNGYVMHMDCKKWSLSTYKRYLGIWNIVIKHLKKVGIKEFYGTCADVKALKFNALFGVKYTGKEVILETGEKQFLSRIILGD